ncbi:3'-5' exonuclease [Paucibacter oligotrophus]|uniref:3'-5' exonuclease n=1 Tax=Roseateles oligotrophus TaxID=1769250 RepID=A0ABT2YMI0_9BURK|nr:3'-5' exonuclease [Roseateles oligotrophus]MCV2371131.1 3'-5' exonuclease [Roseateles oligotrophus]
MKPSKAQTVAVIDFETTGLAPNGGGRATEIAAVLVRDGAIVDSYQSLMKTGAWVPPFIQELTGISNEMLAEAPAAESVMQDLAVFTRACPLVAHSAAFDKGFWQAEMALAGCTPDPAHESFACTVLLSRRLYPDAPNCRLGTLAQFHALPNSGRAHRALADAMTTAHLLLRIQNDVEERFATELAGMQAEHLLLSRLQRANKAALKRCVQDFAKRQVLQAA